ncbi:MAG: type II secretion system protein M [Cellvibrionaceae bacterium]
MEALLNLRDALLEKWQALPEKDQQILTIGAIVLTPLLIYMLLIEPVHKSRDTALAQRDSARESYETMTKKAAEIKASGMGAAVSTGSLLPLIETSAQQQGLRQYLKRLQPSGKEQIQITLEGAGYVPLMRWLDTLRAKGIHPQRADIQLDSKTKRLKAQLLLAR